MDGNGGRLPRDGLQTDLGGLSTGGEGVGECIVWTGSLANPTGSLTFG